MKPHEETWIVHPTIPGLVVTVRMDDVLSATGTLDAREVARLRLASAAPDMARALLEDMAAASDGTMHDGVCLAGITGAGACHSVCARKRAALRKAGVLP